MVSAALKAWSTDARVVCQLHDELIASYGPGRAVATVRLPSALLSRLQARAERLGVSFETMCRRLLAMLDEGRLLTELPGTDGQSYRLLSSEQLLLIGDAAKREAESLFEARCCGLSKPRAECGFQSLQNESARLERSAV